ncbi:MAG: nicotinate-nucleotide adenylyltransferase [bacterium]
MRIGIIGGTFDPPHNGHIHMAQEMKRLYGLNKVIFVPAGIPPHKSGPLTSVAHRNAMLKVALSSERGFAASDAELRRAGKSFTIDTLMFYRKKFGPKAEIFFIVGADSILEIKTWKRYKELLDKFNFVVVARPGYEIEGLNKDIKEKVRFARFKGLAISSSHVRLRVREGISIMYFVPPEVKKYIEKNKLYT